MVGYEELKDMLLKSHVYLDESIAIGKLLTGNDDKSIWGALDAQREILLKLGNDILIRLSV